MVKDGQLVSFGGVYSLPAIPAPAADVIGTRALDGNSGNRVTEERRSAVGGCTARRAADDARGLAGTPCGGGAMPSVDLYVGKAVCVLG